MTGVDSASFKAALGRFPSGVTVVTVRGEQGQDHGMTASAFTSVSLDPPLVLVCITMGNYSYQLIEQRGSFAVNLLASTQQERSNRFAGGSVDDDGRWTPWPEDRDKFADLDFSRGEHSDAALLDGALASLDCSLEAILPGGDHGIFVGRVQTVRLSDAAQLAPLLYYSGGYGHFAAK